MNKSTRRVHAMRHHYNASANELQGLLRRAHAAEVYEFGGHVPIAFMTAMVDVLEYRQVAVESLSFLLQLTWQAEGRQAWEQYKAAARRHQRNVFALRRSLNDAEHVIAVSAAPPLERKGEAPDCF